MKYLIFGSNGWIGKQFIEYVQNNSSIEIVTASSRCDDHNSVLFEIEYVNPDRVINFAGRTSGPGCPNIDFLDKPGNLPLGLQENLMGPINIANICEKLNIHYTYLGTGCIYEGDENIMYTENDIPNFSGNSYSIVKATTDQILKHYSNTLVLRIRLPINDTNEPKNLLSKLMNFKKINKAYNTYTVLPSLFPHAIQLIENKTIGLLNFCNPGKMNFPEIIELFENKGLKLDYEILSEIPKNRANAVLDMTRLKTLCPDVKNVKEAIEDCIDKL